MAKGRSVAELEVENRVLRRQIKTDRIGSIFNNLIRWGGISWIAYCAYLSVDAMAGQTTISSLFVNLAAQVGIGRWLAYAIGAGGLTYGWKQRNLRRDTVERLQERISSLERIIDKRRTSSHLTSRGETRPEER